MKKVLTAMLLVAILLGCVSVVNAATEDELLAAITKTYTIAGKQVKITDGDLVKVQRYLSDYDISAGNCDAIIAKINETVDVLNNAGTTDTSKLSQDVKDEVLSLAQESATLAGASLTYDATSGAVSIYKDGRLYDSATAESYFEFAHSGNNYMVYAIASVVAVIAVATIVFVKKAKVNA